MKLDFPSGEDLAQMLGKIYVSCLVFLVTLAIIAVAVNGVISAHDAAAYRDLPEPYRAGIEKLQQGWQYSTLPDDEKEAIQRQHQHWIDEERLPPSVERSPQNESRQGSDAVSTFYRVVPRWGAEWHQQQPLLPIAISLAAFLPALLLWLFVRWIRWLFHPTNPPTPQP